MVKTEKLMMFGSVRFALFAKSLKTVRFLERYCSRYKILTQNGNELCTVRFALFGNGARWAIRRGTARGKKQKRKTVFFCYGSVNAFLKKTENGTVLGYSVAVF